MTVVAATVGLVVTVVAAVLQLTAAAPAVLVRMVMTLSHAAARPALLVRSVVAGNRRCRRKSNRRDEHRAHNGNALHFDFSPDSGPSRAAIIGG
jgi:hypothetical protein